MRLDLALCRLRFAKTRSVARAMAESGRMRVNGQRVEDGARRICEGDVLTFPRGREVVLARIVSLPERRGPPAEARACYLLLDPAGQTALADGAEPASKGKEHP